LNKQEQKWVDDGLNGAVFSHNTRFTDSNSSTDKYIPVVTWRRKALENTASIYNNIDEILGRI